jgi:hypothetical protein
LFAHVAVYPEFCKQGLTDYLNILGIDSSLIELGVQSGPIVGEARLFTKIFRIE